MDYYKILGVSKDASEQEIKKAYRKLALEHHPDKHKGDKAHEKQFKEINEAYEVLSDKQKRASYDQFGKVPPGGFGGGGQNPFGDGFQGGNFDFSQFGGFGDIFENFFGGNTGGQKKSPKRGPRRGEDIETTLRISFDEAVFGTQKEIVLAKMDTCTRCKGDGAEPGSSIVDCKTCHGSGEIKSVRQTIFGQMMTSRACESCHGAGRHPEKNCTTCHGAGRVRKNDSITLKIPAGVESGSTIRVTGKGQAGTTGGEPGDLYVSLDVSSSKKFARDGYDIHTQQTIHVLQAILGDTISVETLYGPVKLKIPAGTQSGRVFRLKEYGVQILNRSSRGDHFVKITVQIPEKLSKKEQTLYEEIVKEQREKGQDKGFFGSLFD
jgi:molecular chaperone DnaJ